MLQELRITNFAIIDQLEIEFPDGLVVLTGETGAGKSIILDAIEALIGGKADLTNIREGCDRALIEGVFRLDFRNADAINALLAEQELADEPGFVTLSREIRREGRTVARVNGRMINVGLLREIGAQLVDIHGQSEHLSLLNVKKHILLLDRYAGSQELLQDYQRIYQDWQSTRHELEKLKKVEHDTVRKIDLLKFQIEEIDGARLQPGEEADLKAERNRLANAEALAENGRVALNLLDEAGPEMPGISDLLGQVLHALQTLSRIDSTQIHLTEQAETLTVLVQELSRELNAYLEGIEYNPRRLETLENRIELIRSLQRKYGGSIEAVLEHAQKSKTELYNITHATEQIAALNTRIDELHSLMTQKARALSASRAQAAGKLSAAIEKELKDLNMAGARFAVDLQQRKGRADSPSGEDLVFDEFGFDQVEFLIAPNPGEGLKPMVRIASGGETARLMLALKRVLAQEDQIPSLIFDEIDQGIGGRVGFVVGEKLWHLARNHQVLCVTHLPQLAAFGEEHLQVSKKIHAGRTHTIVKPLSGEERRLELAQMLGAISEAHLTTADETLRKARERIQISADQHKG
jgi:DNA repair protein RecN (Recombination protein N)